MNRPSFIFKNDWILTSPDQRRCLQTLCEPYRSLRLRWPPCRASSVSGHIALLLRSMTNPRQYNRSVLRPVRACSLVDVPTGHVVIENTEMGHYLSVCAAIDSAILYVPPILHSFLDLLIHLITRSLEFSRARLQIDTDKELLTWSIPLTFLGK